jgi:hypothetical protein
MWRSNINAEKLQAVVLEGIQLVSGRAIAAMPGNMCWKGDGIMENAVDKVIIIMTLMKEEVAKMK